MSDLLKTLLGDDVSQVIVAVTMIIIVLIGCTVGVGIYSQDFSLLKEMFSAVALAVGGLLALARGRTTNVNGNGVARPEVKKPDPILVATAPDTTSTAGDPPSCLGTKKVI